MENVISKNSYLSQECTSRSSLRSSAPCLDLCDMFLHFLASLTPAWKAIKDIFLSAFLLYTCRYSGVTTTIGIWGLLRIINKPIQKLNNMIRWISSVCSFFPLMVQHIPAIIPRLFTLNQKVFKIHRRSWIPRSQLESLSGWSTPSRVSILFLGKSNVPRNDVHVRLHILKSIVVLFSDKWLASCNVIHYS